MNCRHNLLYFFYSLLKRTKNVYKKKTVMPDVGFEKIRSILSIQPTLDQHNTYRKQSIHLQCKSIEWFLWVQHWPDMVKIVYHIFLFRNNVCFRPMIEEKPLWKLFSVIYKLIPHTIFAAGYRPWRSVCLRLRY